MNHTVRTRLCAAIAASVLAALLGAFVWTRPWSQPPIAAPRSAPALANGAERPPPLVVSTTASAQMPQTASRVFEEAIKRGAVQGSTPAAHPYILPGGEALSMLQAVRASEKASTASPFGTPK